MLHTDARYFPFEARKETHEQRKTKIDIDEFRSGTTNINLLDSGPKKGPFFVTQKYSRLNCAFVLV
jgi:hypothetical protein